MGSVVCELHWDITLLVIICVPLWQLSPPWVAARGGLRGMGLAVVLESNCCEGRAFRRFSVFGDLARCYAWLGLAWVSSFETSPRRVGLVTIWTYSSCAFCFQCAQGCRSPLSSGGLGLMQIIRSRGFQHRDAAPAGGGVVLAYVWFGLS